jgi:hypothetical protein
MDDTIRSQTPANTVFILKGFGLGKRLYKAEFGLVLPRLHELWAVGIFISGILEVSFHAS